MRKTIILAVMLLVLIGIIYVFSQRKKGHEDANANYEGNFTIDNVDQIGKIMLEHRAGPTYTLIRKKDGWYLEQGYRARMSSVEPLLDAMRMVRIKYIPADQATVNVLENIDGTYVHVIVYDLEGNRLKSYRVGGSTPDERGTYMIMDGSKQPFVVHIPSWDGALRTRYTLSLEDWRDRRFMDLPADKISHVTVNYPKHLSQSFELTHTNQTYTVTPLHPELRSYSTDYRHGTGEAYLRAISELACEGYENGYPLKDSIYHLLPFCEMRIGTTTGDTIELRVWPKGPAVVSEFAPPVHRLFIDRRPGDFMLAQYEVIKGILRGYDFFTGHETPLQF